MNKHFIKSTVLLLSGLIMASCSPTPPQQKETAKKRHPNIIIVNSDDMGWGDLACYGNPIHETLNIDAFAEEAVRFTDFYAAAPVCTPTRASIMTGKYPARLKMTVWSENARGQHGIIHGKKMIPGEAIADLPQGETTIAEVLHKQGYHTIHVGKWHLGESEYYPETQGFDINIGGGSWGCPATFFYPYTGPFQEGQRYIPGLGRSGTGDNGYFKDREGEYLTDRLTDEAISIMKDAVSTDKPFFMNLNYYAVHTPIEAPDSIVDYYRNKIEKAGKDFNPTYAAMVHIVDKNVGRVLKCIQDLGIYENTFVLFTSDNGGFIYTHLGEKIADNGPLRSGKGSLHEGGIRIPLIIRYPGMTPKGENCNVPTISNDFYPTLCDVAGINTNEHKTDGLSLLPVLQNPKADLPRESLFWHYPHYYLTTTPVSAVRCGDWKLLKYYESNTVELYNLKDDISEKENLAGTKPEITKEILGKLDNWLKETDASIPRPNPDFKDK